MDFWETPADSIKMMKIQEKLLQNKKPASYEL